VTISYLDLEKTRERPQIGMFRTKFTQKKLMPLEATRLVIHVNCSPLQTKNKISG
jgi:hypothetical protein